MQHTALTARLGRGDGAAFSPLNLLYSSALGEFAKLECFSLPLLLRVMIRLVHWRGLSPLSLAPNMFGLSILLLLFPFLRPVNPI